MFSPKPPTKHFPESTPISRTALDTAAREPELVARRLRTRHIEGLRHKFSRRVASHEKLSSHATNNSCIQPDDGDADDVTVQQRRRWLVV
jgi:hypothetical protein